MEEIVFFSQENEDFVGQICMENAKMKKVRTYDTKPIKSAFVVPIDVSILELITE